MAAGHRFESEESLWCFLAGGFPVPCAEVLLVDVFDTTVRVGDSVAARHDDEIAAGDRHGLHVCHREPELLGDRHAEGLAPDGRRGVAVRLDGERAGAVSPELSCQSEGVVRPEPEVVGDRSPSVTLEEKAVEERSGGTAREGFGRQRESQGQQRCATGEGVIRTGRGPQAQATDFARRQ